jgi:hypothetical protein
MARARWSHPVTSHREEVNQTFATRAAADGWLELQRLTAATGVDHGQTLASYVESLGERWARRKCCSLRSVGLTGFEPIGGPRHAPSLSVGPDEGGQRTSRRAAALGA